MPSKAYIDNVMNLIIQRNPREYEFHQAVKEVLESLKPALDRHPQYLENCLLERFTEPERVIMFRVPWIDDHGKIQVNRGFRVEFNSAIGPYKGGLRFHPSVNLGIMKFLGFEQILKNALTTLYMGGAKGGSDFDPKGKSDREVMHLCQSFMLELYRHIGPATDVPAGDIGVGAREIGFLFGQYKRITNEFNGAITGKSLNWGGSFLRPEATGYGCVYFAREMLKTRDETFEGKVCTVSGSGNVAQFTVEKLLHLGAKVVTISDSNGMIYDPEGVNQEKLAWVKELKNKKRGRIRDYTQQYPKAEFYEGKRPWHIPCQCAFPSATENEISEEDARTLLKNGCYLVAEGSNMPSTPGAVKIFLDNKILYGPGKAANAGGVAVSGLEMAQNAQFIHWSAVYVDTKLQDLMKEIHDNSYRTAQDYGYQGNLVIGANIAGFIKVANAMLELGLV
jgi:glutamate dehydrogenase (NADP+)